MITVAKMRELEDSSEKQGVSKLQLMENAGKGIADVLRHNFNLDGKRVLIVCYHGNNGGDGFVAARYLNADVLFLGDESKLKKEGKLNYDKIKVIRDFKEVRFNDYDFIIDAVLGTGTKGELKEPISSVIDLINSSKAFKVAVDVPTGVNPDTGEVADKAVDPDLIITFHDIKKGLVDYKDRIVVVDIGIPKKGKKVNNQNHKIYILL